MRISAPPVTYPCYLGIDTPSKRQLISSSHTVEEIRRMTGADSLCYLPLENLIRAVRNGTELSFCTGCFDGGYPMDIKACRSKGCRNFHK